VFPAYGEALGAFVALGEGIDDLLHRGQSAVSRAGGVGPGGAGGGKMGVDERAESVAGVGGLLAKSASGLDLVAGEAATGGGDVRQELGVTVQILLRYLVPLHVTPRFPDAPVTVPWRRSASRP
jgi:hypothetical protein